MDLFEATEIILRRKMLVLIILGCSILSGILYALYLRDDSPRTYSINAGFRVQDLSVNADGESFDELNKVLEGAIGAFRGKIVYWYQSDFYKQEVQKKFNQEIKRYSPGESISF